MSGSIGMSEREAMESDFELPVYSAPLQDHDYSQIRVEEALDFLALIKAAPDDEEPEKMDPGIERFTLD